jgi:hypothetical protein
MFLSLTIGSHIARDKAKTSVDGSEPQLGERAMILFLIVFILELLFVVYALTLSVRCGQSKNESQLLHFTVAIFFPWLYVFYAYLAGCKMRPF